MPKPVQDHCTVLLFLALACAGLSLCATAYALGRHVPVAAAIAVPVLMLLLVLRAVLSRFPAWEWALLPWPGYALVQGFVLYALGVTFFGFAAARLPRRWNRVVVLLVAVGVLSHGMYRHRWMAWPERHGDLRTVDASHQLRQSTHYTCGPAACASAVSYCGVQLSERQMAQLCLTREQGSNLFDLYRGIVLALGDRRYRVSIEDLDADGLLAGDHLVVASNVGRGHALCLRTRDGGIVVHDPLDAYPSVWTREMLRAAYRPPAIVIRPLPSPPTPTPAPR